MCRHLLLYLKEAILLELVQNNNKIFVSGVYGLPTQTNTEFNQFLLNFEKTLWDKNQRKPYLTLVTGDFNSRSSFWWSDDFDASEGTKLLSLTSCNGFQQNYKWTNSDIKGLLHWFNLYGPTKPISQSRNSYNFTPQSPSPDMILFRRSAGFHRYYLTSEVYLSFFILSWPLIWF